VTLLWGVEYKEESSNLWLIQNESPSEMFAESKDPASFSSSFDLSEPEVQEWLLNVVKLARNEVSLNVEPTLLTWIEILEEYANNVGIGFPIPKDLFIGYVEQLRDQNLDFRIMVNQGIGTDSPGFSGDFLYASVELEVDVKQSEGSLSEIVLKQWTNFTDSMNQGLPSTNVPKVEVLSDTFLSAYRSEATIKSTITTWFVANFLCLGIILLFTQNLLLSLMVMVTSVLVFSCLVGFIFAVFTIPFGPVEAVGVSIFIGLSANYSLHVVHAYHRSPSSNREDKVKDAVFTTGSPITASALSTIGGCIFLLACRTYLFVELGLLICCITTLALLFSMSFLLAWLTMIGPLPLDESGRDFTERRHRLHQWDLVALLHIPLSKLCCQKSTIEEDVSGLGFSCETVEDDGGEGPSGIEITARPTK